MKKINIDVDSIEDFGFTFDDSSSIDKETANKEAENLRLEIAEKEEQIELLTKLFEKLLTNLSKNPDQETLVWPNRIAKIEEFRAILNDIKKGEV